MRIDRVNTHLYAIPALEKRHDAIQAFTTMELLLVELRTTGGLTGTGYGYTIGTGGTAAKAFLDKELVPLLEDENCECHQHIQDKMIRHTRASSGGPIDAIARAAVDIAVWDIKAKAHDAPLFQLLGGAQNRVPVYDTEGGWLNLTLEELVANASRSAALGFHGVKIKVGSEDAGVDVRRVEAVRRALDSNIKLMIDANQAWTPGEAIRRAKLFEPFDVFWIEEPIAATDITGHEALQRHTSIPIAIGETVYCKNAFAEYLRKDAASILQPDVARIGGITDWMKVAAMAESFHTPIAPHFLMELQVQLAAAVPNGIFVEHIPQLSPVLEEKLVLNDGYFTPPARPGHGILFNHEKLKYYEVQ